jgi:hypothetical protein
MDVLAELSWRAYPAGATIALGLVAFAVGAWRALATFRIPATEPRRPEEFLAGLRVLLVGGAVALIGVAWAWQQLWLLVLGLVIGGEELLETSFALHVLRRGMRRQRAGGIA